MPVHRPVISEDLAVEIEERRGGVPFQRFVNELLRQALSMSGEEVHRQRIERRVDSAERKSAQQIEPTVLSCPTCGGLNGVHQRGCPKAR